MLRLGMLMGTCFDFAHSHVFANELRASGLHESFEKMSLRQSNTSQIPGKYMASYNQPRFDCVAGAVRPNRAMCVERPVVRLPAGWAVPLLPKQLIDVHFCHIMRLWYPQGSCAKRTALVSTRRVARSNCTFITFSFCVAAE
jgi:hypothetical protein